MSATRVLRQLREHGVQLATDGRISLRAGPRELLNEAVRLDIGANRAELFALVACEEVVARVASAYDQVGSSCPLEAEWIDKLEEGVDRADNPRAVREALDAYESAMVAHFDYWHQHGVAAA